MIKAFTLLEVIIAMLITALLVSITYNAYLIINKSYISFTEKNERLTTIILMDHMISRDFTRAGTITSFHDKILFCGLNDTVIYQFENNDIIRVGNRTDTLKANVTNLSMSFEDRKLQPVEPNQDRLLVDDIVFTLTEEDQKIPLHYHKTYSATDLLNFSNNAIN